jgi:hypothetical protein
VGGIDATFKGNRHIVFPGQLTWPYGPVWQLIRKNCTMRHGIDDYAFFRWIGPARDALLPSKLNEGGYNLSEEDRRFSARFARVRFGAETKPFSRTPEITTFFSDPGAKRLVDRACTSRHSTLDRVEQARNSEEGWRALLVDTRGCGARWLMRN